MKVTIFQNYSKNNEKLFKLTLNNHINYCSKYQYSLILDNLVYSKFLDIQRIKNYLKNTDLLITIGSDCVFTNFNIKFQDFINSDKNVAICKQGGNNVITNGQIIFFRNCEDTFNFLNLLNELQLKLKNAIFGTQTIMDIIYRQKLYDFQLIQAGKLQKYTHQKHVFLEQHLRWN